MGNAMRSGRRTKVMKIDGETFKLTTPMKALDVIKEHPDHVLLESEAVKNLGVEAKPLEPHHELQPKKLYFLLHLPDRSGEKTGAVDRLDTLKVCRPEVQIVRPDSGVETVGAPVAGENGSVKVKIRVPREKVENLVKESKDRAEVAEKIVKLYTSDQVEPGSGGARSAAREKRVSFVQ